MTTYSGISKETNARSDAYAEQNVVHALVFVYFTTRMYWSHLTNNVVACIESKSNVITQMSVVIF